MNNTSKNILAIIGIIVFTIFTWGGIMATGYGAQSLTNIIELPVLVVISLVVFFLMKKYQFYQILLVIFFIILVTRILMPAIPE